MDSEIINFIESLEPSESWGFKRIDEQLLAKSLDIASKINGNIHVVPRINIDSWILFIALLPYSNSLDVLSDLCDIIPNFLNKIITCDNQDASIVSARQLCIDRLNILVRKPLHESIFTKDKIRVINSAIKAFHGDN